MPPTLACHTAFLSDAPTLANHSGFLPDVPAHDIVPTPSAHHDFLFGGAPHSHPMGTAVSFDLTEHHQPHADGAHTIEETSRGHFEHRGLPLNDMSVAVS